MPNKIRTVEAVKREMRKGWPFGASEAYKHIPALTWLVLMNWNKYYFLLQSIADKNAGLINRGEMATVYFDDCISAFEYMDPANSEKSRTRDVYSSGVIQMHWRQRMMNHPDYNKPQIFNLTIRLALAIGMFCGIVASSISFIASWLLFLLFDWRHQFIKLVAILKMTLSPFDHIKEIYTNQRVNYFDTLTDEDKKTFQPYMINRIISMNPILLNWLMKLRNIMGRLDLVNCICFIVKLFQKVITITNISKRPKK